MRSGRCVQCGVANEAVRVPCLYVLRGNVVLPVILLRLEESDRDVSCFHGGVLHGVFDQEGRMIAGILGVLLGLGIAVIAFVVVAAMLGDGPE